MDIPEASDWNDNMSSELRILDPNPQSPSAIPDGSKVVPLPTEIYESILDELAESPETLRACALVCHLFAQRAQKLLFSSIFLTRPTKVFKRALGIRSYVWPSMRFLQIISSSPLLAGHVKSLIISDTAHLQFYREELSWIRSDNTVHQILPRLTNLKELGFEGNFRGSGLNFRKWGDNLRVGILEQCSSERLVVIRLTCVRNVPLSLLGLAPRLETLVLKKVLFLPDFTAEEVFYLQRYAKLKERSPPARLKHLSVTMTISEEWRTIYPWLASHLDLMHIKTLDLHIDFEGALEEKVEEGLQAISNLLRGCSATLETLRFLMPEGFHFIHLIKQVLAAHTPSLFFSNNRELAKPTSAFRTRHTFNASSPYPQSRLLHLERTPILSCIWHPPNAIRWTITPNSPPHSVVRRFPNTPI